MNIWLGTALAVSGCGFSGAQVDEIERPGVRLDFRSEGSELVLHGLPADPNYRARYPNPRRLMQMEARVYDNGQVFVGCRGDRGPVDCSESPIVTRVVTESGRRMLQVFDIYSQLLAQMPYDRCGPAPRQRTGDEGGAGARRGGGDEGGAASRETGEISLGLEQRGVADSSECGEQGSGGVDPAGGGEASGPEGETGGRENLGDGGVGIPGGATDGGAAICPPDVSTQVRERFCVLVNENLKTHNIPFTYPCANLDGPMEFPDRTTKPTNDVGCYRQIAKPAGETVEAEFKILETEACSELHERLMMEWVQKVRMELYSKGLCGLSPLVLDLAGDGLALRSLEEGTWFDLAATGQPMRTAWIAGDDALLAMDRNRNGRIDDGSELFGNVTANRAHEDGFAALRELDANHDGRIDRRDPAFGDLRAWRDMDGDGASSRAELMRLSAVGIRALGVAARTVDGADASDGKGNWLPLAGEFWRTDGTRGRMVDVFFRYAPPSAPISSAATALVCRG